MFLYESIQAACVCRKGKEKRETSISGTKPVLWIRTLQPDFQTDKSIRVKLQSEGRRLCKSGNFFWSDQLRRMSCEVLWSSAVAFAQLQRTLIGQNDELCVSGIQNIPYLKRTWWGHTCSAPAHFSPVVLWVTVNFLIELNAASDTTCELWVILWADFQLKYLSQAASGGKKTEGRLHSTHTHVIILFSFTNEHRVLSDFSHTNAPSSWLPFILW